MATLLDVNALIALIDADHVHHGVMVTWFQDNAAHEWATCPIVENGVIRIVSQAAYPSGQRIPQEVIRTLRQLKLARPGRHQFWADDISLADETLFRAEYLVHSRQITDAYLLGLAAKHAGTLLSFDRSLPWQAIRRGKPELLQIPI